jgi:hypothetical protein
LRFRCRCPGAVRENRQGTPAVALAARPLESALCGGLHPAQGSGGRGPGAQISGRADRSGAAGITPAGQAL